MEAKDLLNYIGIDAENMDDFKSKFSEKYVGDEKQATEKWLKPILGETSVKIKNKMLKKAREEGIEFTHSEFEKADIEDVAYTIADRKAMKYKKELEELKGKAGANGDDVVKEWQEKYDKASKRAAEEEQLRKSLAGEFEVFKTTAQNEVKGVKVNYLKTEKMGSLKLKPNLSPLEKTGFESHIEKNYRFDFDDTGKPIVTDPTGNRIRSSKKADDYKTIDEVLTEEAATFKILAENPQSGNPVQKPFVPPLQGQNPAQIPQMPIGKPGQRKINPMFDNM